MYRSNRSFNITLDNPPGLYNFWKTSVEIPPSPGQKAVQNTPSQVHFRRRWGFQLSAGSRRGGGLPKNFWSALRASFGLKIRGDPGPSPLSATVFPPLCIGIKFPTSKKTMIFKFPSLGKSKVSIPWRKPGDCGAEASAVWPILQ